MLLFPIALCVPSCSYSALVLLSWYFAFPCILLTTTLLLCDPAIPHEFISLSEVPRNAVVRAHLHIWHSVGCLWVSLVLVTTVMECVDSVVLY